MPKWEGIGINILLQEGMGIVLYTTVGMQWKWEYGHGNGKEWDRKSHSRTSLIQLGACKLGGKLDSKSDLQLYGKLRITLNCMISSY